MATGGAAYNAEWEVYQAECHYYNIHARRTLQLMHNISKTFKQEWETYVAEARAAASAAGRRRPRAPGAATAAAVAGQAEASVIVGDIFDDGMRPGAVCWAVLCGRVLWFGSRDHEQGGCVDQLSLAAGVR